MKKYHVAAGDGKGYYGVNYESYREATELLKISQRHDPQAHIIEEEYHFTNADRIRAMSDEELAEILIFWNDDWGRWETDAGNIDGDPVSTKEKAIKAELEWLKQPAEVD